MKRGREGGRCGGREESREDGSWDGSRHNCHNIDTLFLTLISVGRRGGRTISPPPPAA